MICIMSISQLSNYTELGPIHFNFYTMMFMFPPVDIKSAMSPDVSPGS